MFPTNLSNRSRGTSSKLTLGLFSAILMTVFSLTSMPQTKSPELKYKPWLEKDWTKWDARDCNITVHSSPWVYFAPRGSLGSAQGPQGEMPGAPEYWMAIQLRSALPIRQLLLRELQLDKRYDKMKAQQREEFDQQHMADLVETDEDAIVVYVENGANNAPPLSGSGGTDYLASAFGPRQVALRLSNGKFLTPTKTLVLKNEVNMYQEEYFFPRMINGKPAFSASDSEIGIFLGDPLVFDNKHKELGPLKLEDFHPLGMATSFPTSKLIYKGKLEY
jgi:hypothetical protein